MRIDDSAAAHRAYSRHDEGITPDRDTNGIPEDQLKQFTSSCYSMKVVITEEKVGEIEQHTRNQADNEQWRIERR